MRNERLVGLVDVNAEIIAVCNYVVGCDALAMLRDAAFVSTKGRARAATTK